MSNVKTDRWGGLVRWAMWKIGAFDRRDSLPRGTLPRESNDPLLLLHRQNLWSWTTVICSCPWPTIMIYIWCIRFCFFLQKIISIPILIILLILFPSWYIGSLVIPIINGPLLLLFHPEDLWRCINICLCIGVYVYMYKCTLVFVHLAQLYWGTYILQFRSLR